MPLHATSYMLLSIHICLNSGAPLHTVQYVVLEHKCMKNSCEETSEVFKVYYSMTLPSTIDLPKGLHIILK